MAKENIVVRAWKAMETEEAGIRREIFFASPFNAEASKISDQIYEARQEQVQANMQGKNFLGRISARLFTPAVTVKRG